MEHFWDLLFQLMKHETNTVHVAFILLFSNSNVCLYELVLYITTKRYRY
jgi:hypothetical protein